MPADNQNNFGIVVAGHRQRDPWHSGIWQLVELIKNALRQHVVSHGYLEFASPTSIKRLSAQI